MTWTACLALLAGSAMAQPPAPEIDLDMLVFQHEEHFREVFEYLEEEQRLRDEAGLDDDRLAPAFQDYAADLGFESLLTHIEFLETSLEGPEEDGDSLLTSENDPDNHHIADPYFRGLLSPQAEVMVGNTIYRFEPHGHYLVPRDRTDQLEAIRLGELSEGSAEVEFVADKVGGAAGGHCCLNNYDHSQEKRYLNDTRRIVSKQWVTNNSLIHRIGARTRHYRRQGSGWCGERADTVELYGSAGFSSPGCGEAYSQVGFQDLRTQSKKAKDGQGTFNNWDHFWVNTYFDTTHRASDNGGSVSDILSMCECREATASFTLPTWATETSSVFLDGTASEEEDDYLLEIFRVPSLGSYTNLGGHWTSWFSGQVGNVDLAGHYNFTHTGSGASVYLVRLGVRNGCTPLDDQVSWISIQSDDFDISYRAYSKGIGWQGWVYNGATAGTTGQNRRMEAAKIRLLNTGTQPAGVCYQAHVQGHGWMGTQCNGATAGTTGQNRRMEAIRVWLTSPPSGCSVEYRAHVKGQGWLPWVANGQVAGTTGQNRRMEALQVRLVGSCP